MIRTCANTKGVPKVFTYCFSLRTKHLTVGLAPQRIHWELQVDSPGEFWGEDTGEPRGD